MANIVSFIIQKGGCGKTTTTVNTGAYLAIQKFRTLCVDMDPQGNLTQHFGYDADVLQQTILDLLQKRSSFHDVVLKRSDYLHILPNNISSASAELSLLHSLNREYLLRDTLSAITNQYDFILIDCPPALGLFSINALAASTDFILVIAPEFFPMKAIKPLFRTVKSVKANLNHSLQFNGVVMTMCDFRTRHSQEIRRILKKNFPDKLYKSYIRANVNLKEASSLGQTIFEYAPHSPGAFDYQNFGEEFLREHHLNKEKKEYYQKKFNSLTQEEKEQILILSKKNLSNYNRIRLEKLPESKVLQNWLLIERNKIIEKLFPYRSSHIEENKICD